MAQATQAPPVTRFEDISDEFTKFQAEVSPTDVEGVKYLKINVTRPFQSSQELADWLYACVNRLENDLSDQGM